MLMDSAAATPSSESPPAGDGLSPTSPPAASDLWADPPSSEGSVAPAVELLVARVVAAGIVDSPRMLAAAGRSSGPLLGPAVEVLSCGGGGRYACPRRPCNLSASRVDIGRGMAASLPTLLTQSPHSPGSQSVQHLLASRQGHDEPSPQDSEREQLQQACRAFLDREEYRVGEAADGETGQSSSSRDLVLVRVGGSGGISPLRRRSIFPRQSSMNC